jgi:hypothetical protein
VATALTTFAAARAAFVEDLGIEPGERLQRVQAAILRGVPFQLIIGLSSHPTRYRAGVPAHVAQPRRRRSPNGSRRW